MDRKNRHLSSDEACALANLNNLEVLRGLELLAGLNLRELQSWGPDHIRQCSFCRFLVLDLANLDRYAIPLDLSDTEKQQIISKFIVRIRAHIDFKEDLTNANK